MVLAREHGLAAKDLAQDATDLVEIPDLYIQDHKSYSTQERLPISYRYPYTAQKERYRY